MPDYISREAAEIAMCDACEYRCKHHVRVSGQSLITADDCYHLRDLYAVPAADVAEVRHGHWLIKTIRGDKRTVCSECLSETGTCYEENYCPNCGAKMDESEEEDDA